MINIDFLTIKAFLIENIDFFIGARLQKIQQPSRRDFVFSLRNNGESRKLYININPQIYHICFMSNENEKRRNIVNPKQPPMFCMLLRKYLEGCKIQDCRVIDNERIIEYHFETIDELSQTRSLCLSIELMGKHSNIILYDRNTSIIIGCAHNVGAEKSRYRELQGGLKYIYPPVNSNQTLPNELQEQFKNLTQEEIQAYLQKEVFNPAILEDRYTLFSELLPNSTAIISVNNTLDNYYSKFQEKQIILSEQVRLKAIVEPRLKKINNSIKQIEILLKKRDNTEKYKLYGELLTANIYQKCDYQDKIEVFDYINNENIIIELDQTKNLKENAQRYYRLYTKAKNTKEKSQEILNQLNIDKSYNENILYSIEKAESIEDFNDIKQELKIDEMPEKKNFKPIPLNIMKLNINNFEVYVGKNNKQNDYIISKLAKDEDIWFHARICAGSHVLLKANNQEVDEQTIYECSKLAREYSSAMLPSKVSIIYTKAKYLRKPPASPLGYVTYKNEKEILI